MWQTHNNFGVLADALVAIEYWTLGIGKELNQKSRMDGFQLNDLAAMLNESMELAEKSGAHGTRVADSSEMRAVQGSSKQVVGTAPTSAPAAPMIEDTFGKGFKAPEYSFAYKQRVEAAEVYGGFSGQTPSNADSQYLVVRFALPGEDGKDVDLDVTETTLTLYAKHHRLHLTLPHPIDPKSVKASFTNQTLRVTLQRIDVLSL